MADPTVVIVRKRDILQLKAFYTDPCRHFDKYQGVKSPCCGCLPCVTKYAQECEKKGLVVKWLTA